MQVHSGTGTITITPSGGSAAPIGSASGITLTRKLTQKEWKGNALYAQVIADVGGEITGTLDFIEIRADLVAAFLSTTATGTPKAATMTNENVRIADAFALSWAGTFNGQAGAFTLPTVVIPDFSLAFKEEDWTSQNVSFKAYAAAGATIMTFTAVE